MFPRQEAAWAPTRRVRRKRPFTLRAEAESPAESASRASDRRTVAAVKSSSCKRSREEFPSQPRSPRAVSSSQVGRRPWGLPVWGEACFMKVPEWPVLSPERVCVELPMGTETGYMCLWHGTEVQKCHTLILKKLEERMTKIPILQI